MNKNKFNYKYSQLYSSAYQQREKGIALVIGLLLLLVITILGVVAMRSTTMQERMSANNQQQTVTFQGAEAAIRKVMDELRAVTPPPTGTTQSILITALQSGTSPTSTQLADTARIADTTSSTSDNGTVSKATLTYTGTSNADGFRMGIDSGSYVSYNFVIDANSSQTNTFASSHHQQVVGRVGPRPQD